MAAVNTEESAENMEYVRRLLKETQPRFSASLELAADLVGTRAEVTEMLRGINTTKARSVG